MKISIWTISTSLVLTCFSLNGQADYLHERGQPYPPPENLPFDVNSIIQQIKSKNHLQPLPYCHSECNEESPYNIWSREGEFLVDTNISYINTFEGQWSPSIAFDGTNYLVVWCDRRYDFYYDIYGILVSQDGRIVNYENIPISTKQYGELYPVVAFNGINYLVVWYDYQNESNIYGTRIDQSGNVLDPEGINISIATGAQRSPSIASDGTNYFVIWEDCRNSLYPDIYGVRINQDGIVLDTAGIPISNNSERQENPSIVFDNTNYFVVWKDYRNDQYSDIYGARVNQAGIVLDTAGIPISTGTYWQSNPTAAFDGTNYMVVWSDLQYGLHSDIYGARVNQSGVVLDSGGIAISTAVDDQGIPFVVYDGYNFLIAWVDRRSGNDYSDIYGARVSQAGLVLDTAGIIISSAEFDQQLPAIASDGTTSLVVWADGRNASWGEWSDIYGARVNQAGIILDTAGIIISIAANDQRTPAVAFDGINYLVVWCDSRNVPYYDLYGMRISQNGILLDSIIAISTSVYDQWYPAVAFDGTNYLVAWQDGRNDPGCSDIYGARITTSGIVLDTGIAISTSPSYQLYPAVAFDGTNYFVVWTDDSTTNIQGTRINQDGVVLDTVGITISNAALGQWAPSIAFDGTNYLVVWHDERNGSYSDIYGTRVNQSGIVLDSAGIAISTVANNQLYPSVAFDGANYLVVWIDCRSGFSSDIYGAKISPTGVVLNTYPISTQQNNQFDPVLARGNGDQILINYSGWCDSINSHPANTMRIWGKFYPLTGIMEDTRNKMQNAGLNLQAYPNPFTENISISWHVSDITAENQKPVLRIYDVTGRLVKDLSQSLNHNSHYGQTVWHGDDDDDLGRIVPAGVYFIRAETAGNTVSEKVILLE